MPTHDLPIAGLFESHLTVRDLNRSCAFYREVLGFELAQRFDERQVAFFWIGAPGASMLGLWQVGTAPLGLKLHIAFRVSLPTLLAAPAVLRRRGVNVRSFGGEEGVEMPSVLAWMPAAALYFADPDGHSLELLAMLPGPGRADWGAISWDEWQSRQRRDV